MGYVIGDHKAVETDCLERLYDLEGIDLAAVDEGLVEVLDRPDDVAEVDVDDFLLAAEVADGADDAVVAAHLRPASHAEIESVMRAVKGVHVALEIVERTANPRDAAEGCAGGRIVRVQGQADVGFLGDGQDAFQIPAVVFPHLVVGEDAGVGQFLGVVFGEGKAGGAGTAAQGRWLGCAPDAVGNPVVAEDWDAGLAHVAYGANHVLELFFATVLPEHDLVVKRCGDVFQCHQPQLGVVGPLFEGGQVGVFPLLVAGEFGGIHQEIIAAHLLDKGELFVGEFVELA